MEAIINALIAIEAFMGSHPIMTTIIAGIAATVIGGLILIFITKKGDQKTDPSAKKELAQANRLLDKGYTDRANEHFSHIILEHGNDKTLVSKAHAGRAESYLDQEDLNHALEEANKAINNNSENGDAYIILGRVYSLERKHALAIDNFTEALRHAITRKRREDIYHYRGIDHFLHGKFDLAIQDFSTSLEIMRNSILKFKHRIDVLSWRVNAYFMKEEYEKAITDCTQILKWYPRNVSVLASRAVTYSIKKDYAHAMRDCSKALKISPHNIYVLLSFACIYADKKDYDSAIWCLTKAIKLDPDLISAYAKRGDVFIEKGDYDSAIADYTKAIELDPNNAAAYNDRAFAYDSKGDYDSAIADYNKAIEIQPDFSMAYNDRGYTYSGRGEYDKAIEDYNEAIKIKPDYAIPFSNRALVYWRQGKYDLALADCNRALEIKPDYANALANRGLVYAAQGAWDRAIVDISAAFEIDSPKIASKMFVELYRMLKGPEAASPNKGDQPPNNKLKKNPFLFKKTV
jgi:tetratricopeptide (TPR) repeat protein